MMKAIMRDNKELKNSGIEWIEDIPINWKIAKIRNVIEPGKDGIKIGPFGSALTNKTSGDAEYKIYGQANLVSGDFSDTKNKISKEVFLELQNYEVIPNDICISMMGTIGKCLTVPYGISKGIMDSHLIKIRLKGTIDNRFFEYVYDKDKGGICFTQMQYEKKGSIMDGLNTTIVKGLYLPLPNLEEQQVIANYLDDRCSKIDAIIAEAKASIEEYKELKQAVIYEAVTKGLDKSVPLKDSGVEWIGKYPSNWKLTHLGKIAEVGAGGTPDRKEPSYWNGDIPWMASGEVNLEYVYDTKEKITKEGLKNSNAKLLPINTVMLGLIGQGKTKGLAAILKTPCCCNQNLAYLISSKKWLHYRYLYYSFKAMYLYLRGIIGESQAGIYQGTIKQLYITLPSVEEQIVISDYLDGYVCKMDTIISEKQSLIEDLEAYKKSLIYEVVTGKRKVVA